MAEHESDDKTRTHIVLINGTMVHHYRIIDKIGAGGMGEVYLAEDTKLKRQVALKFLPNHLVDIDDIRTRFQREAEAVAKLNHPNIVTIYEVSEFKERPFFAMELIEGQSLSDLAKGKSLDFKRIIELSIQICDGLNAAHEKKVIHRDIKPSNIVIDAYGRPKVLDFGLASIQGGEKLTKTGSTLGTVRYMSPEQIQGGVVDHRSDLFSFGVVLYELIAGRTPFEHENEAATLKSIGQDNPEPLQRFKSDVPDELQRIVSKLLEKDSSMRYQSAAGLGSDLKSLVATTASTTVSISGSGKSRWPLAVGIIVAVMVIVVAGIKYFGSGEVTDTVATDVERMMLAVLPFENLGAEEDEYFADGITDEITSRVASLENLGVIARTSVLQYKKTTKRISEIGAELNVDYILEGTIRWDKSGDIDKVRITPQLIRVSDETNLWGDNIQRDMSQIFEVQEEIATKIASALNVTLVTGNQQYRPTENLESYDYYLKGRDFLARSFDQQNYSTAIRLFEKAVSLDSTFAVAFAWKSYAHSYYAFYWEMGASMNTIPARLAYRRAVELDPDLAEAHLARGTYLNLIKREYDSALVELELAREGRLDEVLILSEVAIIKLRQGKWDEALALSRQVIELDPRSIQSAELIVWPLWYMRRYDEALAILDRAIAFAPNESILYWMKMSIEVNLGVSPQALNQTLADWLRRTSSDDVLIATGGVAYLGFFRFVEGPINFDAELLRAKTNLRDEQNPLRYFYTGLLHKINNDPDSAFLYIDSTIILIENRVAKARSDTTGRFEHVELEHNAYELMSLAYSLTDRHDEAIEQARLAMEVMPVEECHW